MNWVINKYYYIVNFEYFTRPRIYPVYFTNKKAAQRAIKQNVKSTKNRAFYEIIKGSKLLEFECTYVLRLGRMREFTKYTYSPGLNTIQKRKSYRTLMRRRLRRMGMLTLVRNKFRVEEKPMVVKLIKNTQKVANSPTTQSVVFRLERKNKNIYYIIRKKKISQKKGILFEVKAWKVDVRKKTMESVNIQIQRKDVIIPHLITELIEVNEKFNSIFRQFRKGTVKINKRKKETILRILQQRMV